MSVFAFSEAGRDKINQDSMLIKQTNDGVNILAIADGMGGKEGGETASNIAIRTLNSILEEDVSTPFDEIFKIIKSEIHKTANSFEKLQEMGTTLTVTIINKSIVTIGHVGDCRVYHLRDNGIISKTNDQTELQKLLDDGVISKRRAVDYHRKNILLSVISANGEYDLEKQTFEIQPMDRLLILSDGAYSLLKKVEIRNLSIQYKQPHEFLEKLKSLIKTKDIKDDYSVALFQQD